jgi:hypothetical protein
MVRGAKLYFQHNFNYIVSMSLLVEETGVAYREKTTNLSQVTNKQFHIKLHVFRVA